MHRMSTKEILAESFKELAETKPINKITITNITDNCGMTQPTFYNHFRDKYDLITWIYLQEAQKHIKNVGKDGWTWKDTISCNLQYFMDNKSFIINALKNTKGMDSFVFQMANINRDLLVKEVKSKTGKDELSDEMMALIKMYVCGICQYICGWLLEPNPMPCDKLAGIIQEFAPSEIRPFICA